MKSPTSRLPHISRFFSATTLSIALAWGMRTIYWSFLILLFAINISMRTHSKTVDDPIITTVLHFPLSFVSHEHAATLFWQSGLTKKAKQEMTLAQELLSQTHASVLG